WYYTRNGAFFAEMQLKVASRLTLSPGVRFEHGRTQMRGVITNYDPGNLPNDIRHQFVLLGISGQYKVNEAVRVYGGLSQAYRPVIFKDIIPASTYEQVDKNLRDANGYTAELGIEGRWKGVHVNMSLFDVLYRNRMGTLAQTGADGQPYTFRTTIGDSRSQGVELLLESELLNTGRLIVSGFTSTAFMNARYINANVSAGTENRNVTGNQVESAPRFTSRNGLTFRYRTASLTAQYSYVGMTYSDALNTPVVTANGARGPVPAYGVWDLNATWRVTPWLHVRSSVNNLLNTQYFTKRPLFYPGPGVWSSDGRNAVLSVGIKI
ncbi:MAG: TonB-dependent receptor, partial [Cytophagaceae bacterium]